MKKFDLVNTKEQVTKTVDQIGKKAKQNFSEMSEKAIEGKKYVEEHYSKAKYEIDKKRLNPVFQADFEHNEYSKPMLLRVVDYNKRKENEACKGALGFAERIRQENVLHLYKETAEQSGIIFYPCLKETLYCINPYNPNLYICLDDYFQYIKKAKVDELEMIAQCLGAKHVTISFKERKKTLVSHDAKVKANVKFLGKSNAEHTDKADEFSSIEVAAEVDFDGNDSPIEPNLTYFKYDSDIQALINMRLDLNNQNRIKSKVYRFEYNTNREMKEKTAANIDAVIKKIGCVGNGSVVSEVQAESRTVLEYKITF